MTYADKYKAVMKINGITYADIGKVVERSPATVKQRIHTETTIHKYAEEYDAALQLCIDRKNKEKERLMKAL